MSPCQLTCQEHGFHTDPDPFRYNPSPYKQYSTLKHVQSKSLFDIMYRLFLFFFTVQSIYGVCHCHHKSLSEKEVLNNYKLKMFDFMFVLNVAC